MQFNVREGECSLMLGKDECSLMLGKMNAV